LRKLAFTSQLPDIRNKSRIAKIEEPMSARIYKPAKTAMQSGTAKTHDWVLEFAPASAREVDPLMGWTSSSDTQAQVKLRFETKEAALAYAAENGIDAIVQEPKERRPNLRPGGYGENFATNRRGAWTH
jgi:NADH dehydrogenase